jgi:hypothetical protein
MVFDELTKQFVPRYGYKANNQGIADQAIVEIKPGQDPFADPWEAAKVEKKERIAKNETKRLRNIERAEVGKGRGKKNKLVTYGLSLPPCPSLSLSVSPSLSLSLSLSLCLSLLSLSVYLPCLDPESVPGIPLEIVAEDSSSKKLQGKRGKSGVRQALSLAQYSTASMGRCRLSSLLQTSHLCPSQIRQTKRGRAREETQRKEESLPRQ